MNEKNASEYMHDAIDHMSSATLFDLGYADLQDRSNTEILLHLIIKKFISLSGGQYLKEIKSVQDIVCKKITLFNFSLFQSLPDYWGLGQTSFFDLCFLYCIKLDENADKKFY